ncbi:uncharacterized protein CELE_C39F7.1 [Caenorhabditis elegans]|uniref:Transmembrane protein n=2 Tax=Caenorhabditis elegans TaxID=6239 RepID=A0A0K3AVD6_CAEEL|nr:Transmembrane protein [Caenorhabditis elegans]CTQ86757.1 Transmembrane protein [Caenorhabditis elegans]|eukprot:NP_001300058.1 Uncharacterized protein CELE_C39F7.1 [Caenorhabditis elegans]
MSTLSYSNTVHDGSKLTKKKKKTNGNFDPRNKREEFQSPMWLMEACVNPTTAGSRKWLTEFLPMAAQLLLADRPAYIIVRNSWNPTPFDHYPSRPATSILTTSAGNDNSIYVSTDAKIWTSQEIRATVEDCDFASGNMWFYIGAPRSSDELFENVIDPLLQWNRAPSGSGELIGSAEDALALLHWNAAGEVAVLGARELKKLASRLGIVIENEDAMVIDCLEEDFSSNAATATSSDEPEVPRRIPIFDMFWVGIALIILQLLYLLSKFDFFREWFA